LNITLTADGRLNLNGKFVDEKTLRDVTTQEHSQNADLQAVIAADKTVPHGRVVAILDVIKSLGVKKFAISIDEAK
jgi:biopolymer transport protein ExbD